MRTVKSALLPLLLLLLTAAAGWAPRAGAVTAITPWTTGQASFYGGAPDGMSPYEPSFGTSVGSCGYGNLNKNEYPFWSVGALATANNFFQNEPLEACGECFEVECLEQGMLGSKPGSCQANPANRSIGVMITDKCPECLANQMDLQALTWAKIANPSPEGGRINIQFRRVECAPPSDLVITVANNRGGDGWLQLQVTKAGGPAAVKNVQVKNSASSYWLDMNNDWGAVWEMPIAPVPPVDIRITANNGATVTQLGAIRENGQIGTVQTGIQFKITDPSDVQPSGNTVDASQDTVLPSAASNASGAGGATVQAFEGPPDSTTASASAVTNPTAPPASEAASPPQTQQPAQPSVQPPPVGAGVPPPLPTTPQPSLQPSSQPSPKPSPQPSPQLPLPSPQPQPAQPPPVWSQPPQPAPAPAPVSVPAVAAPSPPRPYVFIQRTGPVAPQQFSDSAANDDTAANESVVDVAPLTGASG